MGGLWRSSYLPTTWCLGLLQLPLNNDFETLEIALLELISFFVRLHPLLQLIELLFNGPELLMATAC